MRAGAEEIRAAAEAPDPAQKRRRVDRDSSSSEQEDDGQAAAIDFDEALVTSIPKTRAWAPPSFWEREAYKLLSQEGLTVLPPLEGYSLRYHKSTCQWHGCSPLTSKSVEPKWGPGLRSERRALLLVLEASGVQIHVHSPRLTWNLKRSALL